jgi:hypothetical protein
MELMDKMWKLWMISWFHTYKLLTSYDNPYALGWMVAYETGFIITPIEGVNVINLYV